MITFKERIEKGWSYMGRRDSGVSGAMRMLACDDTKRCCRGLE